jgi:hypothetical protein
MGINNLLEVFNEKYARKIAVNFGVLLTAQYLHPSIMTRGRPSTAYRSATLK